jgi:hypothetical protein
VHREVGMQKGVAGQSSRGSLDFAAYSAGAEEGTFFAIDPACRVCGRVSYGDSVVAKATAIAGDPNTLNAIHVRTQDDDYKTAHYKVPDQLAHKGTFGERHFSMR